MSAVSRNLLGLSWQLYMQQRSGTARIILYAVICLNFLNRDLSVLESLSRDSNHMYFEISNVI